MDIVEVIMGLIEKEDDYHDRKERMAWIAGALYFTFSAVFIYWLFNLKYFHIWYEKWGLAAISIGVWLGATIFISLQFKSRWDSVDRTNVYTQTFWSGKADKIKTTKKLWAHFHSEQKDYKDKKGRPKLWRRPGLLIILSLPIVTPVWAIWSFFDEKKRYHREENGKSSTETSVRRRHWREETRYRTEVPVYAIMRSFLAIQLYFIICKLPIDC